MYNDLNMFQIAGAMAQHAGRRQAVVASNVANADTPQFQAKVLEGFRHVYSDTRIGDMRATRPEHHGAQNMRIHAEPTLSTAEPALNGNTVSLEDEMLTAVDVSREHSRALAIYKHTMTVLQASIGRR